MICETCGEKVDKDKQIPGQYHYVCFDCWDKGNFETDNNWIWDNWRIWKGKLWTGK